jgi:uncharacterized membrane protein (UPF0127 family)
MTSVSTRFLGQPRLTKPTFKVDLPGVGRDLLIRIACAACPLVKPLLGAYLRKVMPKLKIRNRTRGSILATEADVADTSKKRRVGLLKHESLPPGQGLWIAPCEAIHTFGMKFPLDVVFLDRNRKVLKVRENMPRGRVSVCLWAHSVLELPAGAIAGTETQQGDDLEFEEYND